MCIKIAQLCTNLNHKRTIKVHKLINRSIMHLTGAISETATEPHSKAQNLLGYNETRLDPRPKAPVPEPGRAALTETGEHRWPRAAAEHRRAPPARRSLPSAAAAPASAPAPAGDAPTRRAVAPVAGRGSLAADRREPWRWLEASRALSPLAPGDQPAPPAGGCPADAATAGARHLHPTRAN